MRALDLIYSIAAVFLNVGEIYEALITCCGSTNMSTVNGNIKMDENSLRDSLWQHKMREKTSDSIIFSCLF